MDELVEVKDSLQDCPFSVGLQCNQKKLLCDRGMFEANCVMLALRGIDQSLKTSQDYLIREGILQACHVLLHKGYLKNNFSNESSSTMRDFVVALIEEAREEGYDWHDVGFESFRK